MKKIVLAVILILLNVALIFGQGTIRGKVLDENGEPAIGATVYLKSNPTHGTVTDFDGNYSLNVTESTPQILVISLISYEKIEEPVTLTNNQVVVKNHS
ncbi:MAG: carboxypeptidase-like regulatory domain-containing protein [Bacteroidetes bacterium]|nr:carboxypeptidase-like regulatory domain-containing protein [Bacteroidota bacterium]